MYVYFAFSDLFQRVLIAGLNTWNLPGALQKWWHFEAGKCCVETPTAACVSDFQILESNCFTI